MRQMPLHIGIVACSAEGAALCYRTICQEGSKQMGGHDHPEVSIHSLSLGEYVRRLDASDWSGVADLMLTSAERLAASGADFLICPDNTIHGAWGFLAGDSPIPWLHIADVVAEEAANQGYRKVGILGTRWLVDGEVYPSRLTPRGIGWMRPNPEDRGWVNRIIMDELVHGRFDAASTESLIAVADRLRLTGADSVVLGCTELPLVLNESNCPLPPLDSTRLLAKAAVHRALA